MAFQLILSMEGSMSLVFVVESTGRILITRFVYVSGNIGRMLKTTQMQYFCFFVKKASPTMYEKDQVGLVMERFRKRHSLAEGSMVIMVNVLYNRYFQAHRFIRFTPL